VALALNRTGVVFKKCDMAGHKPDSNKACGSGTCQHTCADLRSARTRGRCATGRTAGSVSAASRTRSATAVRSTERPEASAGRAVEADRGQARRDKTFADYTTAGKANFGEAAEAHISHLPVSDRSRESYLSAYRTHVRPAYGAFRDSPAWRATVTGCSTCSRS